MKAIGVFIISFIILKFTFTSEQYKTSLISIKKCEEPELPYATGNKSLEVFLESYNSSKGVTLLRGYVIANTVITDIEHRGAMSYGYETPEGYVYWVYELKDLDCLNIVTKILLNTLGVPFAKKCRTLPGKYRINKIDVDKIDHAVQGPMARKYGVWIAIVSFYTKTHTLTCWEARLNVQPVKA